VNGFVRKPVLRLAYTIKHEQRLMLVSAKEPHTKTTGRFVCVSMENKTKAVLSKVALMRYMPPV
jgi:hypothetical protein